VKTRPRFLAIEAAGAAIPLETGDCAEAGRDAGRVWTIVMIGGASGSARQDGRRAAPLPRRNCAARFL